MLFRSCWGGPRVNVEGGPRVSVGSGPGSISSPLWFFSKHSVPSAGRRVCGLALAMDGNVLTSVQASVRHSSPEPFLRPSRPYTPGPLAFSLPGSLPRRQLRGPIARAAQHLGQLQGRAHASGRRSTALGLSGSPEPLPGTPPQEPSHGRSPGRVPPRVPREGPPSFLELPEVPAARGGAPCGRGARRSEERRVGKECLRLCRSRWSPYH